MAQVIIELSEYKELLDKVVRLNELTENKADAKIMYASIPTSKNTLELSVIREGDKNKRMIVGELKFTDDAVMSAFAKNFELYLLRRNDKL